MEGIDEITGVPPLLGMRPEELRARYLEVVRLCRVMRELREKSSD